MCVSPSNSYVEILMANMTTAGGGAFGRYVGHEGGALTNGLSVLIKETPESSLPFPRGEVMNRSAQPRRQPSSYRAGILLWDIQPPESSERNVCCF